MTAVQNQQNYGFKKTGIYTGSPCEEVPISAFTPGPKPALFAAAQ